MAGVGAEAASPGQGVAGSTQAPAWPERWPNSHPAHLGPLQMVPPACSLCLWGVPALRAHLRASLVKSVNFLVTGRSVMPWVSVRVGFGLCCLSSLLEGLLRSLFSSCPSYKELSLDVHPKCCVWSHLPMQAETLSTRRRKR